MKNKDLLNAINEIDSVYIKEANEAKFKKRRFGRITAIAAIASFFAVIGVGYFVSGIVKDKWQNPEDGEIRGVQPTLEPTGFKESNTGAAFADFAIVQASYPECIPYPDETRFDYDSSQEGADYYKELANWMEKRRERIDQSGIYLDDLYPFYEKTMQEFLVSGENTNRIYSPLNLYMALSMLSEITDGNSRAQVLNLLGAPDIHAVRESAAALWTANYCDDGMVTSILANSLWMRQGVDFIPETMQTLADIYHASSFQGKMGSEEFTKAFRSWLDMQTGGLLNEQAKDVETDEDTVLELASTIYFSAQWQERFDEKETREEIFYKADGDVVCDFMHQVQMGICYRGSNFSAIRCGLEMSGDMWLFLPDETADVNEVVKDSEILELIHSGGNWNNKIYARINIALPKFDIVSDFDLIEGLKAMGLSDIFEEELADFSPMCQNSDGISVMQAKHAARVTVDEKGCVAAAYTILAMNDGGGIPVEKMDFVLNRPFLFAITGADGAVLFLGVVEEP
ncbi:MAG: hypothetical protein K2N63_00840 [Lachnospiraceae bacterium]|nr:hypothetical protein [Lachnospiraceae bacterium]